MRSSLQAVSLPCLALALAGCPSSEAPDASPDTTMRRDAPDFAPDDASRADAPLTPDAPRMTMCPPTGPFGTRVGDISPDITLTDCEGVTHTLHELCEKEVVWLFEFADWCPPCRTFAMSRANAIYDANLAAHPTEFAGWMVISEDASFAAPTATTCSTIRDRYGIHMPVLFDSEGALQRALGVPANEVQIVLTEGAQLHWIGRYAGNEVASRIESAY